MFDKIKKGAQASIDASKKAAEISTIFKRKPTAICSRIMKFEDESLSDK